MNIFVLNSGRCGSSTFIRACGHITNYTAGHESRLRCIGPQRLAYPPDHIEADNRLSWLLGRLDQAYGDAAFYVHLSRDPAATAASFRKRAGLEHGIIKAYRDGIFMGGEGDAGPERVEEDYLVTVEQNIELFLKDKSHWMHFRLEQAEADFAEFWQRVGAAGDLAAALGEWQVRYNAS